MLVSTTQSAPAAPIGTRLQEVDHAEPERSGLSRCHRTEGCEKPPGHQACVHPLVGGVHAHTSSPVESQAPSSTESLEVRGLTMQGFCSHHKGFRRHEEEAGMGPLRADPGTLAGPTWCQAGSSGEGLLLLEEPDPRAEPISAQRRGRGERRRGPAAARRPSSHRASPQLPPGSGFSDSCMHCMRRRTAIFAAPGVGRGSDQEACSPSLGSWLQGQGPGQPGQPAERQPPGAVPHHTELPE